MAAKQKNNGKNKNDLNENIKFYAKIGTLFLIGLIMLMFISSSVSSYCSANSNTCNEEYTTNVELNTGSKSSSYSTYSDYTGSVLTNLNPGQIYTLKVTGKTVGPWTEYVKAWIDYNNDGDFTDSGEEIDLGSYTFPSGGGTYTYSKSFTVPSSASSGNKRMRVILKYGSAPSSCGSFSYGEVEDYTVKVEGGGGGAFQEIINGGFEENLNGWYTGKCQLVGWYSNIVCPSGSSSSTDKVVATSATKHSGSYSEQFQQTGDCSIHYSYQDITIPSNKNGVLSFWLKANNWDIGWDSATVFILDTNNNVLATVLDTEYPSSSWTQYFYDLSPYKGQTIRIQFEKREKKDCYVSSEMFIDDVMLWEAWTENPITSNPPYYSTDSDSLNLYFPANNPNYGPNNGMTVQHKSRSSEPTYHYGTYETRAKAASCASDEGLVNAPGFTYWRENIDGVADHSEIDYEVYGTDSDTVDMVIWSKTNRDASKCKQAYHRVNVKTGKIITARECESLDDGEQCWGGYGCYSLPEEGQYTNSIPDFNTRNFNDYAFDWQSNEVKFIINGVTVWDYINSYHIPTHAAQFKQQIWHANYLGNPPTSTVVMEVNKASHEPL